MRGERSQRDPLHAFEAAEHPAAGHHGQALALAGQQRPDLGLGAGVVEDQQAAALAEHRAQLAGPLVVGLADPPGADLARAQQPEQGVAGRHRLGVGAAQVEVEDATGVAVAELVGEPDRERRLAQPGLPVDDRDRGRAEPGEGVPAQQVQLVGTADEVVDRAGQLAEPGPPGGPGALLAGGVLEVT